MEDIVRFIESHPMKWHKSNEDSFKLRVHKHHLILCTEANGYTLCVKRGHKILSRCDVSKNLWTRIAA